MSCLPLPQTWSPKCEDVECYFLDSEVVTNVTSPMIKKETQVDPVLSKVYTYVISGWPGVVDPTLVPYKSKRDELTVQQAVYCGALVLLYLLRFTRKFCKNYMTLILEFPD